MTSRRDRRGRGDNPRAPTTWRLPPTGRDLALLQHPEQFHLKRGGRFPDLVEEHGAAGGLLEDALRVGDGAGEGTRVSAERARTRGRFPSARRS